MASLEAARTTPNMAKDHPSYMVCPKCSAMYDYGYEFCDLHGNETVRLRVATEQEERDFEEYA